MEPIVECLYSVYDLQPILESLTANNGLLNASIQELIKTRVYLTWVVGLNIAIFSVLIVIVFAIFFSRFNK
ncbi:hypothetical protein NE686_07715 [Tissierella carlieri]|uniref:Uncharacterized protein n=1 Tax=Tissierella carlieri TaxID=689904 RepID=A0ABT1S9E6_9FIRM|nr:hypothetical protein [Tissierella carlieri]MCQ4922965.1 hypothetical protein [Tissierella carlieri]